MCSPHGTKLFKLLNYEILIWDNKVDSNILLAIDIVLGTKCVSSNYI